MGRYPSIVCLLSHAWLPKPPPKGLPGSFFSSKLDHFMRFLGEGEGRSSNCSGIVVNNPLIRDNTPQKTNMTIAGKSTMNESMYFLLKMGIFQCRVGFQGCVTPEKMTESRPLSRDQASSSKPTIENLRLELFVFSGKSLTLNRLFRKRRKQNFYKLKIKKRYRPNISQSLFSSSNYHKRYTPEN